MNKPTAKKIVAALRCRVGSVVVDCGKCPYEKDCDEPLCEDAADLIEAQSSEILEWKTLVKAAEWHDLTKNPDDLPQYYERVLCRVHYKPCRSFGWSEDYAIGCVVPIMNDGKIINKWSGDVTKGKHARVLRWQRIIDPLKKEAEHE